MITIPESLWTQMLNEFALERRAVEQVCYFDGVTFQRNDREEAVATTLTIPDATLEAGRFQVTSSAMSQAGKHFRSLGLQRIAQVHTHPSDWTGHSAWDDEWAYSHVAGAISIVLPHFARGRPTLADAGVHIRTEHGWRELSRGEIEATLRVVPSQLDFRKPATHEHEQRHLEPTRRRPWWHVFAFWRC